MRLELPSASDRGRTHPKHPSPLLQVCRVYRFRRRPPRLRAKSRCSSPRSEGPNGVGPLAPAHRPEPSSRCPPEAQHAGLPRARPSTAARGTGSTSTLRHRLRSLQACGAPTPNRPARRSRRHPRLRAPLGPPSPYPPTRTKGGWAELLRVCVHLRAVAPRRRIDARPRCRNRDAG